MDGSNTTDEDTPLDQLSFIWISNVSGKVGTGIKTNISLPGGYHRLSLFVNDTIFNVSETVEIIVTNVDEVEETGLYVKVKAGYEGLAAPEIDIEVGSDPGIDWPQDMNLLFCENAPI